MSTAAISLSPSGSFRAASLKQVWIDRLMTGRARVWNALLAYGQLRAEAEVLRTARQCQASRPELARALRRVANDLAPPAEPYPGPALMHLHPRRSP